MGKILKDDKSLSDYKVVNGSKMALIVRKIKKEDPAETPATPPPSPAIPTPVTPATTETSSPAASNTE